MSSRWTKITGNLGFIVLGRPQVCTNPSPLICNKALQRWHHLQEGFSDFSTTAGALTQHPAQNPAGSRHAQGSHCSQARFTLTRRSRGASKTLPAPHVQVCKLHKPKGWFYSTFFLEVSGLTGFGETHGEGLLPENSKLGWLGAYSRTPILHFSPCMSRSEYTSGNYGF